MASNPEIDKRTFLKTALGVGGLAASAGLITSAGTVKEAIAQTLKDNIPDTSVLAKIKKEGKLVVGYAPAAPWFEKSAKTGRLEGLYYDLCEELGKQLELKMEYVETSWQNLTIALRKGDFDVFGTSLNYTVPRAQVVNYVGPMWRTGRLLITHKEFVNQLPKSWKDFNDPKWTFSVPIGTGEEHWIKTLFPKAKLISTTGHQTLALEPVRSKRAQLYAASALSSILYAKKNDWAHVIDPDNPIGPLQSNSLAIRYGDQVFKDFLDFWAGHMVGSGWMKERYDYHVAML